MAPLGTHFRQICPPSPKWTVDNIPDLSDQVFIVTGGNAGIGKETCKQLLLKNARVYLAARSESKAQAALEELETETGKKAIFHKLDLGDLDAVKKSAQEFLEYVPLPRTSELRLSDRLSCRKETKLNVLIANAGVMAPPIDQLTAQNFDLQFGTNVLGHLLFIRLLYPLLVSTTTPADPSRVVWVSSSAQYYVSPPIKYDWITDTEARKKQALWSLYNQSKFATVQLVYALQRELGDKDGVVFFSLDPGNIKSDLQRHVHSFIIDAVVSQLHS
jgi:retinol dehydrogenase-12